MPKNMVPEVQRGLIAFDGPGMSLVDGPAIPSPVQKNACPIPLAHRSGAGSWPRRGACGNRRLAPSACRLGRYLRA